MRDDIAECPHCGGTGESESEDDEEDSASIIECYRCGGAGEICLTCREGLDDCKCSPEESKDN